MKKKTTDGLMVAAGIVLVGAGLFLLKTIADPQGVLLALPYLFIGIGSGIFGHGMGNVINRRALSKSPELQKQMEIEQKDERNIAIANRAKARAYDMMLFVFGALMIAFALMGAELIVVLLLVFAYLVVVGCGIYYRCKYEKEM